MGTSSSAAQLAAKFAAAADAVAKSEDLALEAAALIVTTAVRANLTADSGGDNILSRVRSGAGAPVGAGYKVSGGEAVVKPRGVVGLLERDIAPHLIPARGQSLKRGRKYGARGGKGALQGPLTEHVGVGVRRHPGTKGKRTWSKAVERSEPAAYKAMRAPVTRALGSVF